MPHLNKLRRKPQWRGSKGKNLSQRRDLYERLLGSMKPR